ncbi:MAG: hypothetical protein H6Q89_2206 [Myxococcaceae bacterium]|nr:hypothetical protein [Myxococcaceae bacterium]
MDPLKLSAADVEKLPEAQALEVLAAHVKAKQKDLPEALAGSKSKPLARAAKKALYQLRSSGVELEAPVAEAGPQPTVSAAPAELPGLLSPVLGTGERMLFFGRPARGGGVEFFQGILHDEFGVQQLDRAETNRSRYRRQQRELVQGRQVMEVPLQRVLEELARGWGQNLRVKNGLPDGAYQNLHYLKVTPDETQLAVAQPEPEDEALAAKSGALHDEPEIQAWLPAEALLETLGRDLEALRAQKAEQAAIDQKLKELAEGYFTPAVRELYARRLWRQGEFFAGTGRPEAGKIAQAQARRMFHRADFGPFGLRLFQKVVALADRAAVAPRPSLGAPPAR